VKKFSVTA